MLIGLMVDIKKCDDGVLKKVDEPKYRQLTKTAIMVVKKPTLFKKGLLSVKVVWLLVLYGEKKW